MPLNLTLTICTFDTSMILTPTFAFHFISVKQARRCRFVLPPSDRRSVIDDLRKVPGQLQHRIFLNYFFFKSAIVFRLHFIILCLIAHQDRTCSFLASRKSLFFVTPKINHLGHKKVLFLRAKPSQGPTQWKRNEIMTECPKCGIDISDTYQGAEPDVGIFGSGWYCDACDLFVDRDEADDYHDDDVSIGPTINSSSGGCKYCGTLLSSGYGFAGGGGLGPYMYCPASHCGKTIIKSKDY